MLQALDGMVSGRKSRLLTAACCRRIWLQIQVEAARTAIHTCPAALPGWAGPAPDV
jgi:hypothetical protein